MLDRLPLALATSLILINRLSRRSLFFAMKFNLSRTVLLSLLVGLQASDDCPDGLVRCGAYEGYEGHCTAICCDIMTEDTCFDEKTSEPAYCAKISDGGCPCLPGQVRCGVNQYSIGYCTDVCCDWETEETCYNPRTGRSRCALRNGGGCDAASVEPVRCNADTEETCYDEDSNPSSCAPIEVGW